MKKTFYDLMSNSAEIRGRVDKAIYHGCVVDELLRSCADCGGDLIKRFDDKDEALKALSNYTTIIREYGYHFFLVEEFYVEENTYDIDEDGDEEWIEGGDVWEYSSMPEEYRHEFCTFRWNEKINRYEMLEGEEVEEDD